MKHYMGVGACLGDRYVLIKKPCMEHLAVNSHIFISEATPNFINCSV